MTVLRDWCTSPSATANPPFQSPQAQLESGVRGNVPAPFGAGERLQSPTYRYLGGSNPARLPGGGAQRCRAEYCDTPGTERREQQGTQSTPKHRRSPLYSTRDTTHRGGSISLMPA
jgi:hypothetical protein